MPSDRSGYSSDAFGSTYAHFQWSKALTTAESDPDPEVRGRAEARIARWTQVIEHALRGTADYGSRTPFAHAPAWAKPTKQREAEQSTYSAVRQRNPGAVLGDLWRLLK